MIKEALQYIVGLSDNRPLITRDGAGNEYMLQGMAKIEPDKPNMAQPLCFATLSSLIDYIKTDIDRIYKRSENPLIVHVENYQKVTLATPVFGHWNDREVLATTKAMVPAIPFGQWLDQEGFVIALQSMFVDKGDRAKVLKLASHVKIEEGVDVSDNGMTQKVVAKNGVASVEKVELPNPVVLAPFRTFVEVEQPISQFVFRMNQTGGIRMGLFEADGGAWKIAAVQTIKEYLEKRLEGENIRVLA